MTVYKNHNTNKFNGSTALLEHLLSGGTINRLSAILFFGVQDLTRNITTLKRRGYKIVSDKLPLKKAIQNINTMCPVQTAQGLPTDELFITEYSLKNPSQTSLINTFPEKRVLN